MGFSFQVVHDPFLRHTIDIDTVDTADVEGEAKMESFFIALIGIAERSAAAAASPAPYSLFGWWQRKLGHRASRSCY